MMAGKLAEQTLLRFRVELFAASQLFTGEALAEFKQLIWEIAVTLDVDKRITADDRSGLSRRVLSEMLDESQTSTPSGKRLEELAPLDVMRERGYRAGWNDRARSLAKLLGGES